MKKILAEEQHEQQIALKGISTPATPSSGYTRVYAKTDGKLYRKDDAGNEYEVGATIVTGSTFIGCRVYQTGATALTTSWVSCAFAAEDFDTNTMHDNSTNNTRITIAVSGKYVIGGVVSVTSNTIVGARIRLNGSTILGRQVQGNSAQTEGACVTAIYDLVAGDYIELQGLASSLSTTGDTNTNFWAYLVGGGTGTNEMVYVLTPGGASLPATNFPALNKTNGTNLSYHTLDFDQTTQETCYFAIPLPPSVTPAIMKLDIWWTAATGSGAVVWEASRRSPADNEVLDATTTPSAITDTVTDTLLATGKVHKCSIVFTTPTDSVAGDLLIIKFSRLPANASDTLTGDAQLIRAVFEISN